MQVIEEVSAMQSLGRLWRQQGGRIVFVPTMGNLHQGHLQLVQEAGRLGDRVVVSIFVNPTQFGAGEDLDNYPRTLDQDLEKLQQAAVDAVFTPSVDAIYPTGFSSELTVTGLSDILCGAGRPGHFTGVATVVLKLLNIVQPHAAVFGEKDFQQLQVIRRLVEDLSLAVNIHGVPTVREADGLAMSSRNSYLDPDQRARAAGLYRTLQAVAGAVAEGARDWEVLCARAREDLQGAGFQVEYMEIRRAADLGVPAPEQHEDLVILAAARIGQTRLIDNVFLPVNRVSSPHKTGV